MVIHRVYSLGFDSMLVVCNSYFTLLYLQLIVLFLVYMHYVLLWQC